MRPKPGSAWHGISIATRCRPPVCRGIPNCQDSRHADFVLGDRDGTTCSREFITIVSGALKGFGYRVRINDPYKGVEIVRRHGRPDIGRHSLQIEINRALYMNEDTFERTLYYATLKTHLSQLIEVIGDYALGKAGAKAAE